ncbi:DUF3090 family protein [Nocardioides terrisoli]|uniref:DUF3090 family protein n=1 Tax=Nocardioides terrisoli TaxID=3388267 RepID=UPI00287B74DE|nr:DUF3090 family protein [Nocardioides marmorisolisilvae]
MPPVIHSYDPPDRFVAGTVGPPGQRTFFLQARAGTRLTSVALEKQQVEILGERVDELLDELMQADPGAGAPGGDPSRPPIIPALTPAELVDSAPLDQPIEEEFRAGTITLSWDPEDARVVIEVFPVTDAEVPIETDEEQLLELPLAEPEPDEVFLVRLPAPMARAFATRTASVVAAGREQCQFCGGPIDPDGHLCPRANGFRRSR